MNRYPLAARAAGLLILLVATVAASAPHPSAPNLSAPNLSAPNLSAAAATAPMTTAPTAAPAPMAPASIVISGFDYHGDLTVKPAQPVVVTNTDPVPIMHTLTDKLTGLFDTGPIASAGGTATFTAPSQPGSYPFGCVFHLTMAGILVVQG